METDAPAEFAMHVRIPAWLGRPAAIAVNGKAADVAARPGTFAAVRRRWRRNDTIEVTLPFSFRMAAVDDRNPDTVAVMRGPVMLVAVDPPEELTATGEMRAVEGRALEFECGMVRMRPFYRVRGETYSTYWRKG